MQMIPASENNQGRQWSGVGASNRGRTGPGWLGTTTGSPAYPSSIVSSSSAIVTYSSTIVGLTLASIPSDREDAVSLSLIENRKQLGLEIDLPSGDWIGVETSLVPPVGFGMVTSWQVRMALCVF
jgi:hypothetical protein